MNKILLAALLTISLNAYATNKTPQASAGAIALSGSSSEAAGGYVNNDNDYKAAASSAIAPSVGTNNKCLVATPASIAVNVLFGGISKTNGFHYSGLCLAMQMNDMDLAQKLMCLEDSNYAKLNAKCGK